MKNNILAYSIYLILSFGITVWVGRDLHKNGYHLILELFQNEEFAKTINNLLLIAYYLVNLGYVALTIIQFEPMPTYASAISEVGCRFGLVLIILGLLHYNNIIILYILSKRKQQLTSFFNH